VQVSAVANVQTLTYPVLYRFQPARQGVDRPPEGHLPVVGRQQQEHIKLQDVNQTAVGKSQQFRETRSPRKVPAIFTLLSSNKHAGLFNIYIIIIVNSNILRWQVFNGLFIARYFLKYLVQNSKEIELINQFELQTGMYPPG